MFSLVQAVLTHNQPQSPEKAPSLFVLTGQSNISNSKNPLSIIEFASSIGYHTVLDAAALAPTSTISLPDYPQLDAMAISFYKMFGFPTGVGALIAKKSFLAQLKRPWFSGGNVDFVQVPGSSVTRAHDINRQFEVYFSSYFVKFRFSQSLYCTGWHDQLFDAASCRGLTPLALCIFAVPSTSTFISPTLSHLISVSVTPPGVWYSCRTNFIPASSTPN